MSVLKSKFQNPRNLDEKNLFFYHSRKNNSKFTTEKNTLSHQLLGRIIGDTNEVHTFSKTTLFQLSLGVA